MKLKPENIHPLLPGLLARVWKEAAVELEPGSYELDETLTVRLRGSVQQNFGTDVAPSVKPDLVAALAVFGPMAGLDHGRSVVILRECLAAAMNRRETFQVSPDWLKEVQAEHDRVKALVVAQLPRQPRRGSVVTKDLVVSVERAEKPQPKPKAAKKARVR